MHIAVFGGTGRVGSRVIEYALAEGHRVRALVRDPAKVAARQGLEVIAGDVLDPDDVARTIAGADAVISGLGGAGVDNPGDAQSQGMRNIVAAMQRLGVRRVLGVAGGGILDSVHGGLRHDQPTFPEVFKKVSAKHKEAWQAMRDSGLDWTMVATGDIVPGERTGVYRTLEDFLPEGARKISVEDVADFLLMALRDGKHLQKRVGAGY
ncbi:MAG TPA: SDR family oxidoreductase [Gemmatimonadaceae bacterium]|nr:SDR family oxidoreductase [Gemmatimonadaceae bacterium]HRQ77158.1 SDR family oxidoreductase [Gemmatimonadaceae bacterium]